MIDHALGVEFQKDLLSLCLRDAAFLMKCIEYVRPDFFESGSIRWIYKTILNHYKLHNIVPNDTVFATEISARVDKQIQLQYISSLTSILNRIEKNDTYVRATLKEFIRKNLFVRGYEESGELYNEGEIDNAFKKMTVAMDQIRLVTFDPPDRCYFFEEFAKRQVARHMADAFETTTFSTGIPDLDACIGGGLSRGELGLIVADSKGGKSIGLNHMSMACVRSHQGRVLHVTLEGSRTLVEDRLDTRFSGALYHDVKRGELDEITEGKTQREYTLHHNWLVLRGFVKHWDYSVLDVERELQELRATGFIPDMVIIDYLDLLKPREYDIRESSYTLQTRVTQELKLLATRNNIAVWTASQATRPKGKQENPNFVLTADNLADCYGKARASDLLMSINFTTKEYQNGIRRLWLDRYRDSESKKLIQLSIDFSRMIFHTEKGKSPPMILGL